VLEKHKIAIFCDGEFWHGKDWRFQKDSIRTNRDYWIPKIERNVRRDSEIEKQLTKRGWLVLRFWGRDIQKELASCVKEVQDALFQRELDAYDLNDGINTRFECFGIQCFCYIHRCFILALLSLVFYLSVFRINLARFSKL
jgi:very-short-patch-repair endonuclease